MILSVNSGILGGCLNDEQIVSVLKQSGFDGYDYSFHDASDNSPLYGDDYKQYYKNLRAHADSVGIVCNQTHAHYPTYKVDNGKYNESIKKILIRAIEATAILGAEFCVIHPWNDFSPEQNAELIFLPLVEHLKKHNVKAAVENMWNYSVGRDHVVPAACSTKENFIAHMQLLPKEHFVACLDLGHASLFGDTAKAIRELADYVKILHVHDTDLRRDSHTIPYFGQMDWDSICKALKDINYDGSFTMEVLNPIKKLPTLSLKQKGLELMSEIGRELIKKIEE